MNTMVSPDDAVLQEDIEYIASSFDFRPFFNSDILITGATGLIGSQITKTLVHLNNTVGSNIRVYAFVRDRKKAENIFHSINKLEGLHLVVGDINEEIAFKENIDYIIHGASITSSKEFIEKPVETIDTALIGTRNMLNIAKRKNIRGFVYLSSMEVFGITDSSLQEVKENNYGYIDFLNPRSSYSESKRMCECLCVCYAIEYGLQVKIARLTQIVGAGIDYNDSRVAAQFARSVIEEKDIILNTEGKTLRPCLYTRDAIAGILTVLLTGKSGNAYTLANKKTAFTIREIAEMVADKISHGKIKVQFDIDIPPEYLPNLNLCLNLNTDKAESLGWKAEIGLEESYRRMIESMRVRQKNKDIMISTISSDSLEKLHKIQMELLDEFVKLCQKHNLTYFLVGGTLLGAIRHQGFIPWDDDIDVGMPRKDMDAFIKICKKELHTDYYISSYNTTNPYWRAYLKMYKNNTLLITDLELSLQENDGIFIDIFPYDNTTTIYIIQKIQYFFMKKIQNTIQLKIRIKKGERKSCIKQLASLILPCKFLQVLRQSIMKLPGNFFSKNIISWAGEYGIKKETFSRDTFFPTTKVLFENNYYHAPKDWNTYLSQVYGNTYMEIPPMEKRKPFNPRKLVFDTRELQRTE